MAKSEIILKNSQVLNFQEKITSNRFFEKIQVFDFEKKHKYLIIFEKNGSVEFQ